MYLSLFADKDFYFSNRLFLGTCDPIKAALSNRHLKHNLCLFTFGQRYKN